MTKEQLRAIVSEEIDRKQPPPPPVQKRSYSILDTDVPLEQAMRWLIVITFSYVLVAIVLGILAALAIGFFSAITGGAS